jgi:predicted dehydrogenase
MEAVVRSERAVATALCDPSEEAIAAARVTAPEARVVKDLEELLALDVDGVVIATPSADHAEQSIRCLEAGKAVFCQKPLGRTADEVSRVVSAAERTDRLLGVDLSYRATAAGRALRGEVVGGSLGQLFAADLVFHNAYGPDRAWFYDARLSGGGCVMDLGIHLVDLALWVLGFPPVAEVSASLRAGGAPIRGRPEGGPVEDYAGAELELVGGIAVQLACSWRLPVGQDCLIEASFFGTGGGASLHNVRGSFYDFTVERLRGTGRELLAGPPDAWGGRAAVAWARKLAAGGGFDPEVESILEVQATLDRIYDASSAGSPA